MRSRLRPATAASPEVLSLDVFDTALIRTCGAPEALYLWLGRRLYRRGVIRCTPEVFARARHQAELDVWEREGGLDAPVTLADFYGELERTLDLDPDLTESLVADEFSLEEQVLRPTRQAAELLAAAASDGLPVVFTSDTYFPASFIRGQLAAHGLWPMDARCFSSSDCGASKASGALFARVACELGVREPAILHLGDNRECDVRAARRAGVRAGWRAEGRLNRYERLMTEARWATAGMSAALAGASRDARMNIPAGDSHEEALREVAAGVAAPFLVAYVLWLLHRAEHLGLERLYFVARDGEVLAELASTLVRRLGRGPEIRYLYASRRSVNLAGTFEATADELEWAFRRAEGTSLGELLARLDLGIADVERELESAGLTECRPSTPVTAALRGLLEQAVVSGRLRDVVLERARARREVVLEYLRQEGLLNGSGVGIVDMGGVGSQARALRLLCLEGGQRAARLFFLGLDRHPGTTRADAPHDGDWLEDAECYLFDEPRGNGIRAFRGLNTGFQIFSAAAHGTVTGYERRGDRVEPVLEEGGGEPVDAWGLATVRETLQRFVEALVLDEDLVDVRADLRPVARALMWEFLRHPTAAEARAWGRFPFEGAEVSAATVKPLAEPLGWAQIARALLDGSVLRGSFPDSTWNSWPEGSTAMSGPFLRASLQTAGRCYRSLRASGDPRARSFVGLVRRLRGSRR